MSLTESTMIETFFMNMIVKKIIYQQLLCIMLK